MKTNEVWKHIITGTEDNCVLFGVDIFDYEWNDIGEIALITDPIYRQKRVFSVYTVDIDGVTERFVAGEFSNGVWGFFLAS